MRIVAAARAVCVDSVPSRRRYRGFKNRSSCRHWTVLRDKATGVRDGIDEQDAAGEVSLIDATPIMVRPALPAVRGSAEHAKVSMRSIGAPQCRHRKVGLGQ